MTGLDRLKSIVAQHFDVSADVLAPETQFFGELDADNLDMIDLVCTVEEAFGVEIHDDEAAELRTVGDLVSLVTAMAERSAA